ncbi:MAG: hypothetical protein IPN26_18015 [Bacteroidetes bacterium]|nr:hypothetical protein [Bacteroidota bacterium]
MFNGNAPAGFTLIRYKVDMQSFTESAQGIHVANQLSRMECGNRSNVQF